MPKDLSGRYKYVKKTTITMLPHSYFDCVSLGKVSCQQKWKLQAEACLTKVCVQPQPFKIVNNCTILSLEKFTFSFRFDCKQTFLNQDVNLGSLDWSGFAWANKVLLSLEPNFIFIHILWIYRRQSQDFLLRLQLVTVISVIFAIKIL